MKTENMKNEDRPGISRRQFLSNSMVATAAVAAFPYVMTRPVFGAEGTEGIRLGVIGTGNQGRGHLNQELVFKNVVAICDVDDKMLAEGRKRIEDKTKRTPATYKDYRKMLEKENLDAVLICTPDHWHALQTIYACAAGKHVYVEKPMALTISETQLMLKAARKYNVVVQNGSMQRSMSGFREACEYVRNEYLGEVKMVRVGLPGVNYNQPFRPNTNPPPELDYDMWLGPAPWRPYNQNHVHYNFRFFWDFAGGQMANWGAHHLDIAQWGLGMDESGPVQISARCEYDPQKRYEVPSWFEIDYRYANGARIICGQSQRDGTTFEGQDGTLWVNRGKIQCSVKGVLGSPLKEDDLHLYKSTNHHQDWYNCILAGPDADGKYKKPICDVEIGHHSTTVCNLGSIACRTGRTIKWDPVKEEIIDDKEAAWYLGYEYRAPWKLPTL